MKFVVIGQSSGASMETIMGVYPRHKVIVDEFIEQGDVVGIGPFGDGVGRRAPVLIDNATCTVSWSTTEGELPW